VSYLRINSISLRDKPPSSTVVGSGADEVDAKVLNDLSGGKDSVRSDQWLDLDEEVKEAYKEVKEVNPSSQSESVVRSRMVVDLGDL
jgi:hypothetical protein